MRGRSSAGRSRRPVPLAGLQNRLKRAAANTIETLEDAGAIRTRLRPRTGWWAHPGSAALPGMNADHLATALPIEDVNEILERNEK
jgi:hypothetical protein